MAQSVAAQPAVAFEVRRPAERSTLQRAASSLRVSGRGMFGLAIALVAITCALIPHVLAPHDPLQQNLTARLQAPVWITGDPTYLLGADAVGRDLLSRMIYGARVSLAVSLASVLVAGSLGVLLGLIAGHFGGALDMVLMRAVDTWYAIPSLVLAIAVAVILGPALASVNPAMPVIVVLGFTTWVVYARIVRGQVLSVRGMDYVLAARVVGAGDRRIMFQHLLPNVTTSLIIVATQQVAAMILFEASLSFLGLGVQPPTPTWGGMVADGRNYVATAWWASTIPGLAIVFTVLGINLLGDWLRDFLDPRQKLL